MTSSIKLGLWLEHKHIMLALALCEGHSYLDPSTLLGTQFRFVILIYDSSMSWITSIVIRDAKIEDSISSVSLHRETNM